MYSFSVLSRVLAASGRDATQAMLEDVARLTMAGDLAACGQRAAAAIEEGVTDFRVVAGYALGVFEERGPEALPEIAEAFRATLADHWDDVRPISRKDRVVDSALCLSLRVIRSSIDFHEARRDAVWTRWVTTMPPDLADRCLEALDALGGAVNAVIDQSQASGEIGRLGARAELSFRPKPSSEQGEADAPSTGLAPDAAERPQRRESESPIDQPATAEGEQDSSAGSADGEGGANPGSSEMSSPAAARRFSLELSAPMEAFIRRLEAFESLVSRSEMAKAAVVARDLREIIDKFDPRIYLPGLLAPHYRLLNQHIDAIAPYWEAADDPVSKAQQQLYQVDLDGFLRS